MFIMNHKNIFDKVVLRKFIDQNGLKGFWVGPIL